MDDDHVAVAPQPTPLALHSPNPPGDVERQVDPPVLSNRLEHGNPELDRLANDLLLSDRTLCVGIKHERMFARRPDGLSTRREESCCYRPIRSLLPYIDMSQKPKAAKARRIANGIQSPLVASQMATATKITGTSLNRPMPRPYRREGPTSTAILIPAAATSRSGALLAEP